MTVQMINLQGLKIDNWIPPLNLKSTIYQLSIFGVFLQRSFYSTMGVNFVKSPNTEQITPYRTDFLFVVDK